jgi:hypothetical protein
MSRICRDDGGADTFCCFCDDEARANGFAAFAVAAGGGASGGACAGVDWRAGDVGVVGAIACAPWDFALLTVAVGGVGARAI